MAAAHSYYSSVLSIITLVFVFSHHMQTVAAAPTDGFTNLPFDSSKYNIQKPYDVAVSDRYSFSNGVHKFWVYSTDKPFRSDSPTMPRCEISIDGYKYTSGVWQFEAEAYVPQGTSAVSIMQVFGGSPSSTTLMLRVYNPNLTYYRDPVIVPNVYNQWFKVNVIHDVGASQLQVYINGALKYNAPGRGGSQYYFKFGVYAQEGASNYMESRWRNVRILRK